MAVDVDMEFENPYLLRAEVTLTSMVTDLFILCHGKCFHDSRIDVRLILNRCYDVYPPLPPCSSEERWDICFRTLNYLLPDYYNISNIKY